MAAPWQVTFQIIPHRAMVAAPRALNADIVRDTDWWGIGVVPPDLRERLATIAGPAARTTPGVERWGNVEGNGVDVQLAGARVSRITAYVDVRKLDSKFAAALLGFVRSAQSVLVREDGWVAEPTVGAFSGALRGHPAWKYAAEPSIQRIVRDASLGDADE
jgi:hypothetical protein